MSSPRIPGVPLWRVAAVVVAILAGGLMWSLLDGATRDLDDESLQAAHAAATFDEARRVETDFVTTQVESAGLLAPLTGAPCSRGVEGVSRRVEEATAKAQRAASAQALASVTRDYPSSFLPALAYAWHLLDSGQATSAERELARLWDNVRFQSELDRSRSVDQILGHIYVRHALATSQLVNHSHDADAIWILLKHAIRDADYLGRSGYTDLASGQPSWYEHRLRRPGCTLSDGAALTTYDLYNNLLQGYVRASFIEGEASRRQRELFRNYQDPPTENPMLWILEHAKANWQPAEGGDESFVWAVSNVERLLRDRRLNGLGPPENPRLAMTMAEIMIASVERLDRVPDDVAGALWSDIADLMLAAERGRSGYGAEEASALDRGLLHAQLIAAIEGHVTTPRTRLPSPTTVSTLEDERTVIEQAVKRRNGAERVVELLDTKTSEVWADLPMHSDFDAEIWQRAVRRDVARGIVTVDGPATERVRLALSVLRGVDAPPEVEALRTQLGMSQRLGMMLATPAVRVIATVLVALVTFAVLWWWAGQMRMRKALFTSFYRLEAQERLRT